MPTLNTLCPSTALQHQRTESLTTGFHQGSATNSLPDLQASHLTSLGLSFRMCKMGERHLARTSGGMACHSGLGT